MSYSSFSISSQASLDAHLADTTDAHDASAISILDTGGWTTETEAESAIAELYAAVDALGGGGDVTRIHDETLGSDTASFDVTSISGSYKHLRLILQGRSTRAAQTEDPLRLRFNNDSGSNYDSQYLQAYGNDEITTPTWAIEEQFAQTSIINLGTLPAASSPSGSAGQLVVDIANYAGTTFNKTITAHCSGPLTDSSNGMRLWIVSGEWRSTSAITRITIFPVNANFLTGSRLTIYAFN